MLKRVLGLPERLADQLVKRIAGQVIAEFTRPEVVAVMARVARSSAKDYLQEQAEKRGEPYQP